MYPVPPAGPHSLPCCLDPHPLTHPPKQTTPTLLSTLYPLRQPVSPWPCVIKLHLSIILARDAIAYHIKEVREVWFQQPCAFADRFPSNGIHTPSSTCHYRTQRWGPNTPPSSNCTTLLPQAPYPSQQLSHNPSNPSFLHTPHCPLVTLDQTSKNLKSEWTLYEGAFTLTVICRVKASRCFYKLEMQLIWVEFSFMQMSRNTMWIWTGIVFCFFYSQALDSIWFSLESDSVQIQFWFS